MICCAQIFLNPAGGPHSVKVGLVRVCVDRGGVLKAVLKPSVAEAVWSPDVLHTRINNIDQWELVSGASGWMSAR